MAGLIGAMFDDSYTTLFVDLSQESLFSPGRRYMESAQVATSFVLILNRKITDTRPIVIRQQINQYGTLEAH